MNDWSENQEIYIKEHDGLKVIVDNTANADVRITVFKEDVVMSQLLLSHSHFSDLAGIQKLADSMAAMYVQKPAGITV